MRGITFQYTRPITAPDPNRMDIACFVGFVPRRKNSPVALEISDWLQRYHWLARAELNDTALLDVPIPIESWESFHQLFAWEQRLDSTILISSDSLPDTVSISDDNRQFKIVVNGIDREIQLSLGDHTPLALASILDVEWDDIHVSAETFNNETYLVFEYEHQGKTGDITIFTHPVLGFPRALNRHNNYLHSYLGAAVRAFFSQGGRKCYVIRMGDPLPFVSEETQRVQQLSRLLTAGTGLWSVSTEIKHLVNAYIPQISLSHERPEDWHGVDHVLGLSDVSYLCLPDLPELLSQTPLPASHAKMPAVDEAFVECSPGLATAQLGKGVIAKTPRCNENGYQVWSRIIQRLIQFLRNMNREVHLISSLPLPSEDIREDFKRYVLNQWFETSSSETEQDIRSAFVQLCYPWLKSNESDLLPEQALPPEGVLTGLLAANALTSGVFNSVAGHNVLHAYDLFPSQFVTPTDESNDYYADFYRHISVFARVPGSIQLISDVTASRDESYRPAVVSRLMSLIVRAARNQGRSTLFEPMSYATWRAVEKSLSTLLLSIFNAGGLRGRTADEAFAVQCNRTTMTQHDIDNGRLIASVSFQPAIPVQRIYVALSLEQGGQVVLQGAA